MAWWKKAETPTALSPVDPIGAAASWHKVADIRAKFIVELKDRLAAAERALELMLAPWEVGRMDEVDAAVATWRNEQQKAFCECRDRSSSVSCPIHKEAE